MTAGLIFQCYSCHVNDIYQALSPSLSRVGRTGCHSMVIGGIATG
jgi:hypothetical protein